MTKNTIRKMWKDYQAINPNVPDDYEAWAFGNDVRVMIHRKYDSELYL